VIATVEAGQDATCAICLAPIKEGDEIVVEQGEWICPEHADAHGVGH
jgi:hypothetical protein